ncbi:uncharacterized protein HHUB_2872 [Halobacterium hubeiense]|uniref:Uncharacterized protein n=1 Tax=Halobacterium hubeiense TaxID=1407499 RepID=A0A0U5H6I5_9EURY|nr:hypothetical protein [Halobacterium hubeiense]CQH58976.1 uncharacterized protein HHUB_2872 [Halobacterium hubeiense]
MRKQIAAVAVAALLVLAGCSAGGGAGTTAPGTATGADAVYESPLNGTTVAQNHEAVVREAGSFTLVSTSTQTQAGQSFTREGSTAVDLDSGAYLSNRTVRGQNVLQYGYGNGTAFQRVTVGNQTQYAVPQQTPNTTQLAGDQLASFVGLFAFSYNGTESADGTTVHVYEANGVDAINESAPGFANLDTSNLTNVSSEVRVTDDGLVTEFGYSLSIDTGDGEASASLNQQYLDVGSTEVSEPAWLDEARANTSA